MTFEIEVRDLARVVHRYEVSADGPGAAIHKVRQLHVARSMPMVDEVISCVPTEPTK